MKFLLFCCFLFLPFKGLFAQTTLDTAIAFTVKDISGITHRLDEYLSANKIVVIDFFTVTCGPCSTYAPEINKSYTHFGCNSSNVIFLGMNWGADNAQVSQFGETYGVQYPEISGTEGNGNHVVMDYNILSYPTVIVIKPDYSIAESYIYPPSTSAIDSLVLVHGGILSECTTGLSSNLIAGNIINCYPNPASNFIICQLTKVEADATLQLFNLSGTPVNSATRANTSEIRINLNELLPGSYFLLLRNRNGIIIDTELVIVK